MNTLVNIIHPYTYKLHNDSFIIGPMEEHKERDERVNSFVTKALELRVKVIHHGNKNSKYVDGLIQDVGFECDPLYKFLSDPRLAEVVTTNYGLPIPNEQPQEFPQEMWELFKEYFTSHEQLKETVGEGHDTTFFIGGILEACVTNAACYYHNHFRKAKEKVFFIPELCVSLDEEKRRSAKILLAEREIFPIDYDKAMVLLR